MVYPVRIIDHILGGTEYEPMTANLQSSACFLPQDPHQPKAQLYRVRIHSRNKDKELNIQEHIGLGQGTFGTYSGLVKGMELYVLSRFITSYCHGGK